MEPEQQKPQKPQNYNRSTAKRHVLETIPF